MGRRFTASICGAGPAANTLCDSTSCPTADNGQIAADFAIPPGYLLLRGTHRNGLDLENWRVRQHHIIATSPRSPANPNLPARFGAITIEPQTNTGIFGLLSSFVDPSSRFRARHRQHQSPASFARAFWQDGKAESSKPTCFVLINRARELSACLARNQH